MFYVLGGRFEFSLQGDSVERGAGEFVFLPRNVPHTWKALTDGAEALVIATPGGFEKFLRESSTVELSQPDGFERVTAIVEKFGMRWV